MSAMMQRMAIFGAVLLCWLFAMPQVQAYQADGSYVFYFSTKPSLDSWIGRAGSAYFDEERSRFTLGIQVSLQFDIPGSQRTALLILDINENALPPGATVDLPSPDVFVQYYESDIEGQPVASQTYVSGSLYMVDAVVAADAIGIFLQFELQLRINPEDEDGSDERALADGELITSPSPSDLRNEYVTTGNNGYPGNSGYGGGIGVSIDPYAETDCSSDPVDNDPYAGVETDYDSEAGCGGDDGSGDTGSCDSGDTSSEDAGCDSNSDSSSSDPGCELDDTSTTQSESDPLETDCSSDDSTSDDSSSCDSEAKAAPTIGAAPARRHLRSPWRVLGPLGGLVLFILLLKGLTLRRIRRPGSGR